METTDGGQADAAVGDANCVAPSATEIVGDFWNVQVGGGSIYVGEFDRSAQTTTTYKRVLKSPVSKLGNLATAYEPSSRELQDYRAVDAGLLVLEHAQATSTDGTEAFAYLVPKSGAEPKLIGPKGTSGYGDEARFIYNDDSAAYIGTDKAFYRVDLQTGVETKIAEHGVSGLPLPPELQVLGRDLWYKRDYSAVFRVSLDAEAAVPQRVYPDGCLGGAMQMAPTGIFCGGRDRLEFLALDGSGRRQVDQPIEIGLFLDPLGMDGKDIYMASQNSPLYRLRVDTNTTLSGPSIVTCEGGTVAGLVFTANQTVWLSVPSTPTEDVHFSLYALDK